MALVLKGIYPSIPANPLPDQPLYGPGGADYKHKSVAFYDYALRSDGFWMFEPLDPQPESADVVVFMHGYGAYNPMAYGKWIKHLVAKGNIVIYPRYQHSIVYPPADKFPQNTATGIKKALEKLHLEGHVRPNLEKVAYIGHSYGATIIANLASNWEKFKIPKPACMLLAQPGTGPLRGARLESYENLPPDSNLLIVVGEHDYVVGEELGYRIFKTAVHTPTRNFIRHFYDVNPEHTESVHASHSEPYSFDLDFDTGVRNYTAQRVLYASRLDKVDFYCFWKLGDALIAYTREGKYKDFAFGNTPEQRFMGTWPDGRPVKELQVFLPR